MQDIFLSFYNDWRIELKTIMSDLFNFFLSRFLLVVEHNVMSLGHDLLHKSLFNITHHALGQKA